MSEKAGVCYFCGEENPTALEEHHLVPRRYNGPDYPENLVTLCGSCHNKIERLYDDTFYERLGVVAQSDDDFAIGDVDSGFSLSASESLDREIPFNNPHIQVENWAHKVTVEQAKWAKRGEYKGKYREWLESHAESILTEYQDTVNETYELYEKYDDYDNENWVDKDKPPAIKFEFTHDSLETVPHVIVVNPLDNGMEDYETPSMMNIDRDRYKQFRHYRLHCSYCHTAYTENRHSDMVRHLQLRHGINREEIFNKGESEFEVYNA